MDKKGIAKQLIEKYKKAGSNSENIYYKEIVKKKLLENEDLIYALNNEELEKQGVGVDAYYGVNIKPFLSIPETQHAVGNYIMFDTSFDHVASGNTRMKYVKLTFIIIVPDVDVIDPFTGIARHDLIGAIITDGINWTNAFGIQMRPTSDVATFSDSGYATRTIIFSQTAPMSWTQNGKNIMGEVRR